MSDESVPVLDKETMGIREGLPLRVSDGGIAELRRDVQRLMDIEAIKQVKHAYFRCIDTANWDELETLFHDDVRVHFVGSFYEWKARGKAELMVQQRQSFHREAVGHHNGHHPEIHILGETEANGIWYLTDNMWVLNHQSFTTGTALYWDQYVKVDGRWLIKETRYRRIYEISRPDENPPQFTSHYLKHHGTWLATDD